MGWREVYGGRSVWDRGKSVWDGGRYGGRRGRVCEIEGGMEGGGEECVRLREVWREEGKSV